MTDKPKVGRSTGRAGKGRPRGSRNKLPSEVKELILGALQAVGGEQYLVERALDPRTAGAFLTLLGKVLPMQVTGPGTGQDGGPLVVQFVRTVVDPRAATGAK